MTTGCGEIKLKCTYVRFVKKKIQKDRQKYEQMRGLLSRKRPEVHFVCHYFINEKRNSSRLECSVSIGSGRVASSYILRKPLGLAQVENIPPG